MAKKDAITRYRLIINKLRQSPASLKEIQEHLDRQSEIHGYDFRISARTFQRDVQDILTIFDIEILYDFSTKLWRIESESSIEKNQRLFEHFDVFNALKISDRLSENIYFENRPPMGSEYLYGIVQAIEKEVQVAFKYQSFYGQDEAVTSDKIVEPYAIKEFKNRWYLIARDVKYDKIKTFGLERMSAFQTTRTKYTIPANFDIDEHYRNFFGIVNIGQGEPEEVILSFEADQGKYLKSLPMHSTQEVLIESDKEFRIRLHVHVAYDFVREVLAYGSAVQVLAPQSLIAEIKNTYSAALNQYG